MIQPDALLHVAHAMGALPRDEALERSVINRLYYCAHHEAAAVLGGLSASERNQRHTLVIDRLSERDSAAADLLDSLRRRRTHADYDLTRPWRVGSTEEAWDETNRLRRLLGRS